MKCLKPNGNLKKTSGVQVYLIRLREHMENNLRCSSLFDTAKGTHGEL